jgi:hypothetical protein
MALAATTICGLFADLISGLSTAPGNVEVVNVQLAGAAISSSRPRGIRFRSRSPIRRYYMSRNKPKTC